MDNQNEEVNLEEIKALKKYKEGAMGIVGSVICFVFGAFFLLISLLAPENNFNPDVRTAMLVFAIVLLVLGAIVLVVCVKLLKDSKKYIK